MSILQMNTSKYIDNINVAEMNRLMDTVRPSDNVSVLTVKDLWEKMVYENKYLTAIPMKRLFTIATFQPINPNCKYGVLRTRQSILVFFPITSISSEGVAVKIGSYDAIFVNYSSKYVEEQTFLFSYEKVLNLFRFLNNIEHYYQAMMEGGNREWEDFVPICANIIGNIMQGYVIDEDTNDIEEIIKRKKVLGYGRF